MMGTIGSIAKHYTPAITYVATLNNPLGSGKDDTSAINTTLSNASKAGGGNVHAPGGNTWNHSGTISVPAKVVLRGDGVTSIFAATSAPSFDSNGTITTSANLAISLNGNGAGLANCKLTTPNYPDGSLMNLGNDSGSLTFNGTFGHWRDSQPQAHMVYVSNGVNGFTIDTVTTVGGASGGFYSEGATNGLIQNCSVSGPLSDGIGLYSGTQNTTVKNCTVTLGGDDLISVLPYTNTPNSSGIIIQNNTVSANYWGRGLSDVGGNGNQWINNYASACYASGMEANQDTGAGSQACTNGIWNGNTVVASPVPSSNYANSYLILNGVTGWTVTNNMALSIPTGKTAYSATGGSVTTKSGNNF